jgi:hypothetical protein
MHLFLQASESVLRVALGAFTSADLDFLNPVGGQDGLGFLVRIPPPHTQGRMVGAATRWVVVAGEKVYFQNVGGAEVQGQKNLGEVCNHGGCEGLDTVAPSSTDTGCVFLGW